jgi:alpha-L-fucosidase
LKLGIYLSPWDRHEPSYGDSPKYDEFFRNQLRELLTNYGAVGEVWFDGACEEGPNGKRQVYDWHRYFKLIRELQPQAVIAIMGPDVRWAGNERGCAREDNSSIVTIADADVRKKQLFPGQTQVWYPAECDVSIRPGWFYHENQNDKVKSAEQLVDIYYKSVGRNAVLLLNVPPDKRGLIHETDAQRLLEFGREVQRRFGQSIAETNGTGKVVTLAVPSSKPIDHVIVMEDIAHGERIQEFVIEGETNSGWQELATGRIIGHKRIFQFSPVEVSQVRLRVTKNLASPLIRRLAVFHVAGS